MLEQGTETICFFRRLRNLTKNVKGGKCQSRSALPSQTCHQENVFRVVDHVVFSHRIKRRLAPTVWFETCCKKRLGYRHGCESYDFTLRRVQCEALAFYHYGHCAMHV